MSNSTQDSDKPQDQPGKNTGQGGQQNQGGKQGQPGQQNQGQGDRGSGQQTGGSQDKDRNRSGSQGGAERSGYMGRKEDSMLANSGEPAMAPARAGRGRAPGRCQPLDCSIAGLWRDSCARSVIEWLP